MPRKKSKEASVVAAKIEAVAKATAEAKATYSRKTNVTVVVPEDVTRAKAGAWLDLISPLTQWAGLKGDALQHKRELLRIQQEETLTEIAFRSRQRLSKDLTTISPVPIKFMVPFLEQASLEDPDSVLVDLWANLLVSASEDFNPHQTHFISIISRISPSQGEILKEIVRTESLEKLVDARKRIEWVFPAHHIGHRLNGALQTVSADNDGTFSEFVKSFFDWPGVEVVKVEFYSNAAKDYRRIDFDYGKYKSDKDVDYSILEAVGLLRSVDTNIDLSPNQRPMFTEYYYLTHLGFEFVKACKIVT